MDNTSDVINAIDFHTGSIENTFEHICQWVFQVDTQIETKAQAIKEQDDNLQAFKEETRKQQRDTNEVIQKLIARIGVLEAQVEQTKKLATRAIKRAKCSHSHSPAPKPIR